VNSTLVALSVGADIVAILGGLRYGFRWLDRRLKEWLQTELESEVKRQVSQAIKDAVSGLDRRVSVTEGWMNGFNAARWTHHEPQEPSVS
jgi:hypothetical protein